MHGQAGNLSDEGLFKTAGLQHCPALPSTAQACWQPQVQVNPWKAEMCACLGWVRVVSLLGISREADLERCDAQCARDNAPGCDKLTCDCVPDLLSAAGTCWHEAVSKGLMMRGESKVDRTGCGFLKVLKVQF